MLFWRSPFWRLPSGTPFYYGKEREREREREMVFFAFQVCLLLLRRESTARSREFWPLHCRPAMVPWIQSDGELCIGKAGFLCLLWRMLSISSDATGLVSQSINLSINMLSRSGVWWRSQCRGTWLREIPFERQGQAYKRNRKRCEFLVKPSRNHTFLKWDN